MHKEPLNIPCVDCELELAESPVQVTHLPRAENYLDKLRQLWQLATKDERQLFMNWVRNQPQR